MKKVLLGTFALALVSSTAIAEPVRLGDADLDRVNAGFLSLPGLFDLSAATADPVNGAIMNENYSAAVGILSENVDADAQSEINSWNEINFVLGGGDGLPMMPVNGGNGMNGTGATSATATAEIGG